MTVLSSDARRNLCKVLVPSDMIEGRYTGEAIGMFHPSSGILNVYSKAMAIEGNCRGLIARDEVELDENGYDFFGFWRQGELVMFHGDDKLEIQAYDLVQNVFSRNSGLLESAAMRERGAVIFGCGSVGSLVALELARSGVGNFALVDNDVIEYHNVCRHQCGVREVGEYKVDAVKRRILDINPLAHVQTFATLAEHVSKEALDEWLGERKSIAVGCADNREADVYVNSLCVYYRTPFLSIGFWERAFAGEVFYWLPESNMPCYKCALGEGSLSRRNSTSRRLYTTQEELSDVRFEPGIAVDVDFVSIVGVKLLLDIFNIGNEGYTARLFPTLRQYTLVCNTDNPAIGGDMAEIFSYPLQVTTSLEVSFRPGCSCHDNGGQGDELD
ncbi:ThiF family adenylyltransferase [Arabiibacter massiliensis]|uniref:ThiF family adenylyltransferase n=1 Tax=Arabiibacter massiliensis TaxID=1870985 RepID=UPI0009BA11BA|nr:ThiF family adenylyltransferase [Arabiibacter massiliensis]